MRIIAASNRRDAMNPIAKDKFTFRTIGKIATAEPTQAIALNTSRRDPQSTELEEPWPVMKLLLCKTGSKRNTAGMDVIKVIK